jgi:hypothetical protein
MRAKLGDKMEEGTFSLSVSRTGRGFSWHASGIGPYAPMESLDGYDPATKRWKRCAFRSNGEHRVTYYQTDAKSLRGKQATFQIEELEAKEDGTTVRSQSKTTFVMGPQDIKILVKELVVGNEKKPDEEWTYERKK